MPARAPAFVPRRRGPVGRFRGFGVSLSGRQATQFSRDYVALQGSAAVVQTQVARSVPVTQGRSAGLQLAITRGVSIAQAQAVTPQRAVPRAVATTQGQATSRVTGISRYVSLSQGSGVSLLRGLVAFRAAAESSLATLARQLLRFVAVGQGQSVLLSYSPHRDSVVVAQGASVAVRRAVATSRTLAHGSGLVLVRSVGRRPQVGQGSGVMITSLRRAVISLAQNSSLTLDRLLTRQAAISQAQAVALRRAISLTVVARTALLYPSGTLYPGGGVLPGGTLLAPLAMVSANVGARKVVTQGQVVLLARGAGRTVAASQVTSSSRRLVIARTVTAACSSALTLERGRGQITVTQGSVAALKRAISAGKGAVVRAITSIAVGRGGPPVVTGTSSSAAVAKGLGRKPTVASAVSATVSSSWVWVRVGTVRSSASVHRDLSRPLGTSASSVVGVRSDVAVTLLIDQRSTVTFGALQRFYGTRTGIVASAGVGGVLSGPVNPGRVAGTVQS